MEEIEFIAVESTSPKKSPSVISISSTTSTDSSSSNVKQYHMRKRNEIRGKFKPERKSESSDVDCVRVTRQQSNKEQARMIYNKRGRLRKCIT